MACVQAELINPKRWTLMYIFITVTDSMSGHWYLRSCCMLRFWARAALVCGDEIDGGQNDGVLFLQHVSVLEGVSLMRLCRSEVPVAMLRRE